MAIDAVSGANAASYIERFKSIQQQQPAPPAATNDQDNETTESTSGELPRQQVQAAASLPDDPNRGRNLNITV
ncbi:MAG: hypothetical protein GC191_17275 [Azospirillum sp.]|nr:hypothetical protein [Azospirillum sp.]